MQPFLGEASNQLTSLGHWMSLDHNHQTLDESQLHRAFAQHSGEGAGPWLLCGHTHTPLYGPMDPSDYSRFTKYINSGSGIGRKRRVGYQSARRRTTVPVLVDYLRSACRRHRHGRARIRGKCARAHRTRRRHGRPAQPGGHGAPQSPPLPTQHASSGPTIPAEQLVANNRVTETAAASLRVVRNTVTGARRTLGTAMITN